MTVPTLAARAPEPDPPSVTGRSEALRAQRRRYVSRAVGHATSVVVERGRGAQVWDADGRAYLDFAAGIGTLNVGHCHPRVVAAIQAQAARLTHAAFGVALYEPYMELARALHAISPGAFDKKVLFANSGAEAVENAVKVARAATGRSHVVAFTNGFHGRTLLAMALTAKDEPYKHGFGPFPAEVLRAPQPYAYRPAYPSDEVGGCLAALERLLKQRLLPPRVTTYEQLEQGLDILAEAIADVNGRRGF